MRKERRIITRALATNLPTKELAAVSGGTVSYSSGGYDDSDAGSYWDNVEDGLQQDDMAAVGVANE